MNVRKRSGDMNGVGTSPTRNANTKRENATTQAKKIPNTISTPVAMSPAKVKGTITSPGKG